MWVNIQRIIRALHCAHVVWPDLEAQAHEGSHRQGIAALLEWGRRNGLEKERLPLTALADAELDAKITALAGTRGLSLLLRETLEEERLRRQGAQVKAPPA